DTICDIINAPQNAKKRAEFIRFHFGLFATFTVEKSIVSVNQAPNRRSSCHPTSTLPWAAPFLAISPLNLSS
ncbi:MAG: hypothetical protein KDE54_01645, partial [Caldilineaceae bacterium]|nr:hypothetical protein [Caldilineaceae bacterium]